MIDRKMDSTDFARRLARRGSTFVGDLHGHHHIEDAHYFPLLARTEPGIERGFALLDRDHQALDSHLAGFTDRANAVLRAVSEARDAHDLAGGFLSDLNGLDRLLHRHLEDEEELVVPVILKHGGNGLG
jgi:hemerythrin-like domain-containing protein